LPQG
jgi:gas vesicle protein